jgi:hypothetical protein
MKKIKYHNTYHLLNNELKDDQDIQFYEKLFFNNFNSEQYKKYSLKAYLEYKYEYNEEMNDEKINDTDKEINDTDKEKEIIEELMKEANDYITLRL